MSAAASGLKGKLTVTVHQAKDLKDVQLLGKQDPYVTLIIGNETFKTKVVANAGNSAEWNQAFLFNLTGVEDALHIKVNDKETLIDRPIGRCDIGLLELCQKASKGPTTFQLVDVDNFNQMAGQLSLSVEFNGTGLVTSSTTTPSVAAQTPPMQQQTHPMQPVYPPQQSVPVQATTQPTPTPVAAPSVTQQQHDVHKDKDKDKDKKDKKDTKHKDKKDKKGSKKDKKGSKKKKKHEGSHSSSSSDSSSSDSDSD